MKLIRFPRGDDEVLLDPEKVSHISRETASGNMIRAHKGQVIVCVSFSGDEWLRFDGKDAKRVWDYFENFRR